MISHRNQLRQTIIKRPPSDRRSFRLRNLFDEALEALWSFRSQGREHLAVYLDTLLIHRAYKAAVGKGAQSLEPRVDADMPEALKIVLFVAAVGKRILAGMKDCLFCRTLLFRTGKAVAFYLL